MSNSIKILNKLVNADLKHLVNLLNPNKIPLNIEKTKIVIFNITENKFEDDIKKGYVVKKNIFS